MIGKQHNDVDKQRPVFFTRHYQAVAAILIDIPYNLRVLVARKFAAEFAKDNEHFKEEMFMSACGMGK